MGSNVLIVFCGMLFDNGGLTFICIPLAVQVTLYILHVSVYCVVIWTGLILNLSIFQCNIFNLLLIQCTLSIYCADGVLYNFVNAQSCKYN